MPSSCCEAHLVLNALKSCATLDNYQDCWANGLISTGFPSRSGIRPPSVVVLHWGKNKCCPTRMGLVIKQFVNKWKSVVYVGDAVSKGSCSTGGRAGGGMNGSGKNILVKGDMS